MSSQAHKLYNELHNAKDEADRNANNTWTETQRMAYEQEGLIIGVAIDTEEKFGALMRMLGLPNTGKKDDRRWFEGKVAGYDHALKSLERIFGEQERDNETH